MLLSRTQPQFSGLRLRYPSRLTGTFFFFLIAVVIPKVVGAEVYQFVDAHGTVSLTNVPSDARFKKVETESSRLRPMFSGKDFDPMIARHARQHGVHPALVRAVIKTESDFDPRAISRAGAVGLMQLMPETAVRVDVQDLFDPEENIRGGVAHLRYLLDRFRGNLSLALAAYNAGEHVVDRYQTLPPFEETQHYVAKVLRYYRHFLLRERSATASPVSSTGRGTSLPPLVFSAASSK